MAYRVVKVNKSKFLDNEKNIEEWSVGKAVKMSVLLIDYCKLLDRL